MKNLINKNFSKECYFVNKPPNNNKFIVFLFATSLVYMYLKKDN